MLCSQVSHLWWCMLAVVELLSVAYTACNTCLQGDSLCACFYCCCLMVPAVSSRKAEMSNTQWLWLGNTKVSDSMMGTVMPWRDTRCTACRKPPEPLCFNRPPVVVFADK
jgi:hypothetical protein